MNTPIGGIPLRNLRWVWAPYVLHRRKDGAYVALNRQYRPIGCKERGNLESCPMAFVIPEMTPKLAARLSFHKSPNTEMIYLYDEAHAPQTVKEMATYFARLALLAKQHVEYFSTAKLKAELRAAFRSVTIRPSGGQLKSKL